jgi:hypothetical protein
MKAKGKQRDVSVASLKREKRSFAFYASYKSILWNKVVKQDYSGCVGTCFQDTLLKNTSALETLINKLLSNNFEIKEHMNSLLSSFLGYETSSFKSTQEEYEEMSIH